MGRQRVQIPQDNQETKAKTSGMESGAVVCVCLGYLYMDIWIEGLGYSLKTWAAVCGEPVRMVPGKGQKDTKAFLILFAQDSKSI